MSIIYIALGSNIDPEKNMRDAAARLREKFPAIRFSSVYRTTPRDETDQPDFLNAAASFETDLDPESLLKVLQKIEKHLAKNPPYRRGPRTIDLDILVYCDLVLETETLQIPHARMHERRFVLEPLNELIDPETQHPILQKSWEELFRETMDQECERTDIHL